MAIELSIAMSTHYVEFNKIHQRAVEKKQKAYSNPQYIAKLHHDLTRILGKRLSEWYRQLARFSKVSTRGPRLLRWLAVLKAGLSILA